MTAFAAGLEDLVDEADEVCFRCRRFCFPDLMLDFSLSLSEDDEDDEDVEDDDEEEEDAADFELAALLSSELLSLSLELSSSSSELSTAELSPDSSSELPLAAEAFLLFFRRSLSLSLPTSSSLSL